MWQFNNSGLSISSLRLFLILISAFFVFSGQECKDKEEKEKEKVVSLKESDKQGDILVKRLKLETGEEEVEIRTSDPPIQLWYQNADQEVRWIHIVVKTEPVRDYMSRPNFDGFLSKKEYDKLDLTLPDQSKQGDKRKQRIRRPNPFMPLKKEKRFVDKPSKAYTYFETYIILCKISKKGNPEQWKAEIMQVWKWLARRNKQPELLPTKPTDKKFKKALKGAQKDFENGFQFDKWYNGKPPKSKI